jgi:hypothetical protein
MFNYLRSEIRNRLRKRYGNNITDVALYGEQFAYGHREILLEYAELPGHKMFAAIIPHGKIAPHVLDPISPQYDTNNVELLTLLWRDDAKNEATENTQSKIDSIGAPILYALLNLKITREQIKQNIITAVSEAHRVKQYNDLIKFKKILYMPLHTWDGEVHAHQIHDDHIVGKLAPSKVTVLLGYLDFCNPETFNYYKNFGFDVACCGVRASKVTGSPAGGRTRFLYNLLNFIRSHDVVISNEFTTGLIYAYAAGKPGLIIKDTAHRSLTYSSYGDENQFNELLTRYANYFNFLTMNSGYSETETVFKISTALGYDSIKSKEYFSEVIPIFDFN